METTVKERLLKFIKFKELSTHKFEKTCGLSTGYVANIRVSIQPDKIQKIAHKFSELNTGWLLTGEGNMLKDNSEIKHIGAPYYNVDFLAGFDLIFNDQTTIPSYYIDYKPYNGKDVLWCNITGHSTGENFYSWARYTELLQMNFEQLKDLKKGVIKKHSALFL